MTKIYWTEDCPALLMKCLQYTSPTQTSNISGNNHSYEQAVVFSLITELHTMTSKQPCHQATIPTIGYLMTSFSSSYRCLCTDVGKHFITNKHQGLAFTLSHCSLCLSYFHLCLRMVLKGCQHGLSHNWLVL